jgi:heparinase II/III-like protein
MREAFRRGRATVSGRRERAMLDELAAQTARLQPELQALSSSDLLKHFRERDTPSFLPGFELAQATSVLQRNLFPDETHKLIESARLITTEGRWPLLGFGEKDFGRPINWHRDPLSGRIWPLDYHADIPLWHNDGSDIRVLWELNRLGHLVTLGRAYAVTKEEQFATEFVSQVESWRQQNPVGRGANWSCAMEVALRAMNLLAAFSLFRTSPNMSEETVSMLLTMFEQHGAHIRRNLEFSHLATSNHYLSDIAGLLWLGIMLPELSAAKEWRAWALAEMLREMNKQILFEGADYEASTGYHRFVLELFLYSFILCRANDIPIADKYWRKLHQMLDYLRGILRPDGFAPLIGDTDGGQVLPVVSRSANDHAYLLALGATVFDDSQFKLPHLEAPPELLWLLGEEGLRTYEQLANAKPEILSQAFPDAGTYVMRHDDLFLLFNASGAQPGRPNSHRHNDALSVEISACGRAFIVDPGSYVYTANLHERHLFRSTAYHSTVEVDRLEQNSTDQNLPFVIGNEVRPRMLEWGTGPEIESVDAEHYGYRRLPRPVTHRRRVAFNKRKRYWFVSDKLTGEGEHDLSFRFHFAPGLETSVRSDGMVEVRDKMSGARLVIQASEMNAARPHPAELEGRFSSHDYGEKEPSTSACWFVRTGLPFALHFVVVPISPGEDEGERLSLAMDLED